MFVKIIIFILDEKKDDKKDKEDKVIKEKEDFKEMDVNKVNG